MILVACERTELAAFYRGYLNCCNKHCFGELDKFVDQNVDVKGAVHGLRKYGGGGLRRVVEAFPTFHWDLQHLRTADDPGQRHYSRQLILTHSAQAARLLCCARCWLRRSSPL